MFRRSADENVLPYIRYESEDFSMLAERSFVMKNSTGSP